MCYGATYKNGDGCEYESPGGGCERNWRTPCPIREEAKREERGRCDIAALEEEIFEELEEGR